MNLLTRAALFASVLGALVLVPRAAHAQLHWDVGAEVGVMKRTLSSRTAEASDAGLGPAGEIHAHVALLPLVRVGGYLGHDISPQKDTTSRQITSFGARVKLNSPWPRDPWHAWVFIGFGYAAVYGPSYSRNVATSPVGKTREDFLVDGSGGGYFEIPIGIGVGYKLRKPLEITAELSGKLGFGFSGSLYDQVAGRVGHSAPGNQLTFDNPGNDTFGLGLLVGVSFDL